MIGWSDWNTSKKKLLYWRNQNEWDVSRTQFFPLHPNNSSRWIILLPIFPLLCSNLMLDAHTFTFPMVTGKINHDKNIKWQSWYRDVNFIGNFFWKKDIQICHFMRLYSINFNYRNSSRVSLLGNPKGYPRHLIDFENLLLSKLKWINFWMSRAVDTCMYNKKQILAWENRMGWVQGIGIIMYQ